MVFILAFHTGVGGTAIASLLAQGIAGILCFFYAVKKYSYFEIALKQAKFERTVAKQILKICIPMGFQYSFIYLSSCILQWVINGFGTSVIGAFTANNQNVKILKYENPDDDHTDELEKLRQQCFITDTKARKIWT